MKLLKSDDIIKLINEAGILNVLTGLHNTLKTDFSKWNDFTLTPRHACHYPNGVIELMPTTTDQYYGFKYVNGHPINTSKGKLSIIGFGALADTVTGFPLLLADMTLLTALRTAATSALAMSYMARKNSHTMALIGTGAQSEFQTLAAHTVMGINTFRYFDIDAAAMDKYANNLKSFDIELIRCSSILETIKGADIITTATAKKEKVTLLNQHDLSPGITLNTIGGDCPGKTELDPAIIKNNRVVVDFLEQALVEGEIQNLNDRSTIKELWQVVSGDIPGRETDEQITVFDSVGCAVEDHSALRYTLDLANSLHFGEDSQLIPEPQNPKDLFGLLT